jgi:hypothetical protein
MNFINVFLFEVDCSKSARNEESSSRSALNSGLPSADSGLLLDLEIALSGVSAKVKPPTGFLAGRKCVEASGDVIRDEPTRLSTSVYWTLVLRLNRRARRHVLSIYWFRRKTFRLATVRALWHSRPRADQVMGAHSGQTEQSRLDLGLGLSRRF